MQGQSQFLSQEHLTSILREGVGEMIHLFSRQQYRIQPIRQSLVHKLTRMLQYPDANNHSQFLSDMTDKVSIFMWVLVRAPGVWIMLLNEQRMCSETTELDLYLFTSKVYKRLVKQGNTYMPEFQHYCNLATKAIIHYLQFLSNQITFIYNVNKKLVVQEIDELNTDTKGMKLLNKYMVFKLLKELNDTLRDKLKKNLESSVFCYVDPDHRDSFVNYIIDKHDIISFVLRTKNDQKQHRVKQISIQDQFAEKILMLGSNMKKARYRNATREDGKKAILLEVEKDVQDDVEIESYLITIDEDEQLLVYNPAFTRKKWSIEDRATEDESMNELVKSKDSVVKDIRGAPHELEKLPKNAHTIGGSLGNCLANLNKYDNFQSFLMDFSAKAVVSTSLNYVVSNIPMIGYVLVSGGFSMSFYNIIKNDFKSGKKKMQDMGTLVLGSTTSIGTGFIGGLLGSAFIPIPVLGFFLGGLVGGFVGGITSNVLSKALSSAKFQSIVRHFQSNIHQTGPYKGSWDSNKKTFQKIGTQEQYFFGCIPERMQVRMQCDRHWLALIGFCILTFHETNNQIKQSQKKRSDIQKGREVQLSDFRVSEHLQLSLDYLQRTRIQLRPNIANLESFFKEMFSTS